ncbi:hypothetical protein EV182_006568, partial [Spiromyces aspiralis]
MPEFSRLKNYFEKLSVRGSDKKDEPPRGPEQPGYYPPPQPTSYQQGPPPQQHLPPPFPVQPTQSGYGYPEPGVSQPQYHQPLPSMPAAQQPGPVMGP